MKTNRILSTAGMCMKNSTRLRSYCNLIQRSLIDKWLIADDFVQSHVCLVRDDYLKNIEKKDIANAQVIVVINVSGDVQHDHKYQISTPLTAAKIKQVLNKISSEEEFTDLHKQDLKPRGSLAKFKSAFSRIRKNLFGKKGRDMLQIKQKSRQQFISKITKTIKLNEKPPIKIVLLGSPGSGKTSAIQSVSSGKALSSEVSATDSVASDKPKTTVGIDYAEVRFKDLDRKIQLIGTPGQIKFNFIWDMVGKSANAFIILLDMSRPEPLSYLNFYLKFLKNELGHVSQVYCAFTHCEKFATESADLIAQIKGQYQHINGIYKIDAREKNDIAIMLADVFPALLKELPAQQGDTDMRQCLSVVSSVTTDV